jgi:hypothetical protein
MVREMASAFSLQQQHDHAEPIPRNCRQLDRNSIRGRSEDALAFELGSVPPYVPYEEDEYPEGGVQAWLVVLGAWCAMVPSTGMINTFGVLQAWVAQHELASYSESAVGWIFSIHAFIVYFLGAQVGMVGLVSYAALLFVDGYYRIALRCLWREAFAHSRLDRSYSNVDVFQC